MPKLKKLKTVLQETSAERYKAGPASLSTLTSLRRHRQLWAWVFLALVLALLATVSVGLWQVVRFATNPEVLATLAAAMGLSVGAAIELLRRVWLEWSRSDLLILLLEDASDAQITLTIDKLIDRL